MVSKEQSFFSMNNCFIHENDIQEGFKPYENDVSEELTSFSLTHNRHEKVDFVSHHRKNKLTEALQRNIKRRLQAKQRRF